MRSSTLFSGFFSRPQQSLKSCSRNLFTISLTYRVSLKEVDKHIQAHREFLKEHYEKGVFIASGAKVPRTGGIIIASLSDKSLLDTILKKDPFYRHNIAAYEITEFKPTMYSEEFKDIAIKDNSHKTHSI